MIQKCVCKNEYQDKRYGVGMRVHTVGIKGDKRCTVCGPKARKLQRVAIHAGEHAKFFPSVVNV